MKIRKFKRKMTVNALRFSAVLSNPRENFPKASQKPCFSLAYAVFIPFGRSTESA